MKICRFYGPGPQGGYLGAPMCNWVASDNRVQNIFLALKGLKTEKREDLKENCAKHRKYNYSVTLLKFKMKCLIHNFTFSITISQIITPIQLLINILRRK